MVSEGGCMRGLATLPQGSTEAFSGQKDGRHARGPADDALLGGVLGVSRSVEHEVLSSLSYPRFLLSLFSCIVFVLGLF